MWNRGYWECVTFGGYSYDCQGNNKDIAKLVNVDMIGKQIAIPLCEYA
jgi:hypothetical protein